jgi:DNA-binding beta-propeller fold protein YncE
MRSPTKNLILSKALIFSLFIHYFTAQCHAQESIINHKTDFNEQPAIQYISQFSSSRDLPQKNHLPNRIFNFLFGTGEESLVRPFNLLLLEDNQYIVLDQGMNNLMYIQQEEGDFYKLSKENFPSPVGICRGSDEVIYFTDSYLNTIFSGKVSEKNFRNINDTLNLKRPTGIACAVAREELWIAETMAHQITVINFAGTVLRHYGARGTGPCQFNFPTFIWIDNRGLVYIVDSMNFRVQILNLEGEFISSFGETGDATGYFARPKGIATDSYGNIYVVDALFHTVQIFNDKGQFLSNFGEQGREPGQFWIPTGIYIDNQDNIYVADSYNSRIQKFRLKPGVMNEN